MAFKLKKAEKVEPKYSAKIMKERDGIILYGDYVIKYCINPRFKDSMIFKLYEGEKYLSRESTLKDIKKYADSLAKGFYKFKPFQVMHIDSNMVPIVLKVNTFNVGKGVFNCTVDDCHYNRDAFKGSVDFLHARFQIRTYEFKRNCFLMPLRTSDRKRIKTIRLNSTRKKKAMDRVSKIRNDIQSMKDKLKTGKKILELCEKFS